jgi:CheY-like chemotaxis protein
MDLLARDSIRIVHIDDDADFAARNARVLESAGFTHPIVRCSDGHIAVRHFSTVEPELTPHVILLELHLPGMSGLAVLDWVRRNYSAGRNIAVYLFTSSKGAEHRKQISANGITEYILKSHSCEKLIEKLDDWIARHNCPSMNSARTSSFHSSETPGNDGVFFLSQS